LEDAVVFTGWIPEAAARAVPAFDVFFQPSRWEAMSIAILEAMAAARAIVATRVGDNPRVLEDGVTGLLVEPGDVAAMAEALARLTDSGLRQKLGETASATFAQAFSPEDMIRNYERVYVELGSERRR
jgi:glycosyltransferase involved in cell wall biosynthesis